MSSSGYQLTIARGRKMGILFLFALLPRVLAQSSQATAQDPPTPQLGPFANACSFGGTLLHIPSKASGSEGLLVRVSPPEKTRYPEGAPVAVHMSPRPNVGGSTACLSEQGF